ncbi:MAG TPA: hypothetical protein VGR78_18105 [Verrucomicrobiae bacterium]|nr:hypothetical protein [Verrucomicrobiae bacterium]
MLIHLMCGMIVEKIGLAGLKSVLPGLQFQDRSERVALLNKKRISFNEVQARERSYARIVEPNLFKRLWYSIYWRVYFFGFGPKPDVDEKYNSLITDIDETARTGAAQ